MKAKNQTYYLYLITLIVGLMPMLFTAINLFSKGGFYIQTGNILYCTSDSTCRHEYATNWILIKAISARLMTSRSRSHCLRSSTRNTHGANQFWNTPLIGTKYMHKCTIR